MILQSGREVTATLSDGARDGVRVDACQVCKSLLEESQILDSVRALNLRALDEIVLRRLVSVNRFYHSLCIFFLLKHAPI